MVASIWETAVTKPSVLKPNIKKGEPKFALLGVLLWD